MRRSELHFVGPFDGTERQANNWLIQPFLQMEYDMADNDNNSKPMTIEQLQARIAELELKNKALKGKAPATSLKVTEKGGVSMYGLGRFPVTLYLSQWTKLLDNAEAIKKFLADNDAVLAKKE